MTRCPLAFALVVLPLFPAGCITRNPHWDGRADASGGPSTDDDAEGTGVSTSTGETSSGETSNGETSNGATSGGSSTGVPSCNVNEILCDGECTDARRNPRACGLECVDCVEMSGMLADCMEGECRPDDSRPGDDDD